MADCGGGGGTAAGGSNSIGMAVVASVSQPAAERSGKKVGPDKKMGTINSKISKSKPATGVRAGSTAAPRAKTWTGQNLAKVLGLIEAHLPTTEAAAATTGGGTGNEERARVVVDELQQRIAETAMESLLR